MMFRTLLLIFCCTSCVYGSLAGLLELNRPPVQCKIIRRNKMSYDCDQENRLGSSCSLTCRFGYRLKGNKTTTCTDEGFSPSPRRNKCVRDVLAAPKCKTLRRRKMMFKCSGGNGVGSNCTVSCKRNFRLIGTNFSTCTSNGFFPSFRKNRCTKETTIRCYTPRVPKMIFRCTDGNKHESFCLITCRDPNTKLIGVRRTICLSRGFTPSPFGNRCVPG